MLPTKTKKKNHGHSRSKHCKHHEIASRGQSPLAGHRTDSYNQYPPASEQPQHINRPQSFVGSNGPGKAPCLDPNSTSCRGGSGFPDIASLELSGRTRCEDPNGARCRDCSSLPDTSSAKPLATYDVPNTEDRIRSSEKDEFRYIIGEQNSAVLPPSELSAIPGRLGV